ncbi:MAG TPA: LemA family protein [Candidatus Eisenbacteria bacterium]
MRKGMIALAVVVILVIMVAGALAGNYNRLVTGRESVNQLWAQVNNQLLRRNDLIGNLVETVKGTAAQEQTVFGQIAEARAAMAGAKTPAEAVQADQKMEQALGPGLGRLLVVVENYPQLKSNEAFVGLMDELAGTENRLAVARMRYNEQVQTYNVMVKRFPTNLYAAAFNFKESPYYEVTEAQKQVPKVDFSGLKK